MTRSVRCIAGALLTAAVLGGCGFDEATNQINEIVPGTIERDHEVDVINTLLVASNARSGTLYGYLANNNDRKTIRLVSITGDGLAVTAFEPVPVPADGATRLGPAGIRVSGEFTAGDFITITMAFSNGEEAELDIPVMANCYEFEGLDEGPSPTGDVTPGSGQPEVDPELLESPSGELPHEPGAKIDCTPRSGTAEPH